MTKRILIVAAEKSVSGPLSEILVRMGLVFAVAESMENALRDLAREGADLILCEFTLPDGTAMEFCRRLDEMKQFNGTPVLCLASSQQMEHYSESPPKHATPHEWLSRPMSRRGVTEKVQFWLFGRHAGNPEEHDEGLEQPVKFRPRRKRHSGTFKQTPFARLIYEVIEHDGPGLLQIRKDDKKISIQILNKMAYSLNSDLLDGESFGRFLIKSNRIGKDALTRAIHSDPDRDLKEFLIHNEILDAGEISEALIEFSEEIILELFSWESRSARYHFSHDARPSGSQVQLALHACTLIFEGVRRHYSNDRLGMIFAKKDRLSSVLYGTPKPPNTLPTTAHRILDAIDNHRSATEVMDASGLAPLRFFQTLYAMWVMDLTRFGPNIQEAPAGIDHYLMAEQDAFIE